MWVKNVWSWFLTLVLLRVAPLGLLANMRRLLLAKWLFLQNRLKYFLYCPYWKKMLSALRVTLARTGWELQGGEAGQCSLMLERCQGQDAITPSNLLATAAAYMCTLSDESGLRTWQSHGACAARPAVRAFHVLQMWAETLWVCSSHYKLSYLKLCSVFDAYQVFTAVWAVSHFSGDTLKPYHQYLIFSLSQDITKVAFAFTARVKELKSVKGLFTLSISSAVS